MDKRIKWTKIERRLIEKWWDIYKRCYRETHSHYGNYGGRGIKMCDDWLINRISFIKWSIENGWKEGLYIDRINNELGYSPENCRFVTPRESNLNRRNSIFITFNGETKTIKEWSAKTSIPAVTIYFRLYKQNKSIEEAFNPNYLKRTNANKKNILDNTKCNKPELIQMRTEESNRLKDISIKAEYEEILSVMQKVNFNKSKAAKILGIDRKSLYNKIKLFNDRFLSSKIE